MLRWWRGVRNIDGEKTVRRSDERRYALRENFIFCNQFSRWFEASMWLLSNSWRSHSPAFSRIYDPLRPCCYWDLAPLSFNDTDSKNCTITSHATMVNHLFTHYAVHAEISSADEESCNFKQSLLTPWDFSQKLHNLQVRCRCRYIQRTLLGIFVAGVDPSMRSIMNG